MVGRWSTLQGL